ncbi:MAG: ribonuclease H family protein [Saprospiraceae bacterium]
MAKKQKYYVVWDGVNPGIYNTWAECKQQTKGYPNAKYKSFYSKDLAVAAYENTNYEDNITVKRSTLKIDKSLFAHEIIQDSLSIDAACSGNPGIMEYRGVWTTGGVEVFKIGPLNNSTNNIGEFLALVHGLAYLQKINKINLPIYSDSRTAMSWVRKKKVKTILPRKQNNKDSFALVDRALIWLSENTYKNPILKWETKKWGEIPADFGRK